MKVSSGRATAEVGSSPDALTRYPTQCAIAEKANGSAILRWLILPLTAAGSHQRRRIQSIALFGTPNANLPFRSLTSSPIPGCCDAKSRQKLDKQQGSGVLWCFPGVCDNRCNQQSRGTDLVRITESGHIIPSVRMEARPSGRWIDQALSQEVKTARHVVSPMFRLV